MSSNAKIKNNLDDNSTELWIDGEFQASWALFELKGSEIGRIEAMLRSAVSYGEDKKSKEIRKVIGVI